MTDTAAAHQLHSALGEVVQRLGGQNPDVVNPHWVDFDVKGALVTASVKEGTSTVRIRATLLDHDLGTATADDVGAWIATQPMVAQGVLEPICYSGDHDEVHLPRLVFEIASMHITTLSDRLQSCMREIERFGEAWRRRAIVESSLDTTRSSSGQWERSIAWPLGTPPRSAWLLIGDDASWPDDTERAWTKREGEVGIHSTLWTAPKTIEAGDLVLIYFVAPRKAACFVARASSAAFWRNDIEVNADRQVAAEQWWVYLTPPVEIRPITYAALSAAENGHLPLRGRSGHFLQPDTIDQLTFEAKEASQQAEVDLLVQRPQGRADFPPKEQVEFAQWQNFAPGAFKLEADVSNYVVEPMLRWALGQDDKITRVLHRWGREHKVGQGYVDFVLTGTFNDDRPLVAIEVKLAVRRAATGRWLDSPDFRQLRRYMDDLDVPGMLVDARSIFLVEKGADRPLQELRRAEVSEEALMEVLRYFPLGMYTHEPAPDEGRFGHEPRRSGHDLDVPDRLILDSQEPAGDGRKSSWDGATPAHDNESDMDATDPPEVVGRLRPGDAVVAAQFMLRLGYGPLPPSAAAGYLGALVRDPGRQGLVDMYALAAELLNRLSTELGVDPQELLHDMAEE